MRTNGNGSSGAYISWPQFTTLLVIFLGTIFGTSYYLIESSEARLSSRINNLDNKVDSLIEKTSRMHTDISVIKSKFITREYGGPGRD